MDGIKAARSLYEKTPLEIALEPFFSSYILPSGDFEKSVNDMDVLLYDPLGQYARVDIIKRAGLPTDAFTFTTEAEAAAKHAEGERLIKEAQAKKRRKERRAGQSQAEQPAAKPKPNVEVKEDPPGVFVACDIEKGVCRRVGKEEAEKLKRAGRAKPKATKPKVSTGTKPKTKPKAKPKPEPTGDKKITYVAYMKTLGAPQEMIDSEMAKFTPEYLKSLGFDKKRTADEWKEHVVKVTEEIASGIVGSESAKHLGGFVKNVLVKLQTESKAANPKGKKPAPSKRVAKQEAEEIDDSILRMIVKAVLPETIKAGQQSFRVEAVKQYMADKGLTVKQIEIIGNKDKDFLKHQRAKTPPTPAQRALGKRIALKTDADTGKVEYAIFVVPKEKVLNKLKTNK